ncbi:MAG: EamA family transporter [bacterium]|nr:EamA family transporter [bacterium]
MSDHRPLDRGGLAHLLVVYLAWGSTYLGIRLAVSGEGGFPPFTMAGLRVFAAAAVLLGWARLRRERVLPRGREWILLGGSGLLLWVGGNGLVTWAEMRASSGLAALLVAAMPLWGESITLLLDRKAPAPLLVGSILLGFAGVGVLSWPVLRTGSAGDIASVVGLLLAPLFWAMGSIWFQRRRTDMSVRTVSGWQQLLGGVGLAAMALGRGEIGPGVAWSPPDSTAWMAWAYLVVVGSVFAFTSYVITLGRLPYRVVMTYAYVNPVIAVFLGWLLIDEPVTRWTLAGAVLVVAGVVGVFRNRG